MHIHCPHCQNPIEVVESTAREEIQCPSCGSSFRLEGEATTDDIPRDMQRRLGKFVLLEVVGKGAFGTVYKARDPELDRLVAIKVLRTGDLASREERDRFLREARSVAQLRHPAIVPVHEVGQIDEMPYLVSEFIAGVTLTDLLTARRLSPLESARLIAAIADALQHAHEQGVIHRDVKPSNIMLSDGPGTARAEYTPHVMDFGLAKREAGEIAMTMDGQVLGTPAYMSPEQARGDAHKVDGRSDVYSLGVILYELLIGERPFRGNVRMLLHQVLHDEPRAPRTLNNRIPRDLETICLKALAKTPGRRYASAAALSDDLQRFLKGEPVQARPVSRAEKLWRWCGRNPGVAGLTAAVALALVAGTVTSTYFAVEATEHANRADLKTGEALLSAAQAQEEKTRANEAAQRALDEKEGARRHLYAARMTLIQRYWDDGVFWRVGDLLQQCAPQPGEKELRGWEWAHQERLQNGMFRRLAGHKKPVLDVAFRPDGQQIASASADGTVKLWDAASNKELRTLSGHTNSVTGVAYSPNGQWLASISDDGTLKVWNAFDGQELRTITHRAGPNRNYTRKLAFSPDSSQLASPGGEAYKFGEVKLWEVHSGKELRTLKGHSNHVTCIAFSPDGKQLASSTKGGGALKECATVLWDLATGQILQTLEGQGPVHGVAFSPDGQRLASASWDPPTVKVWDVRSGQELRTFTNTATFEGVAVSPDGQHLAAAASNGTWLWNLAGDQKPYLLPGQRYIQSVAFSPDGQRLAASGSGSNEVHLWNLPVYQEYRLLNSAFVGNRIACSPDGQLLASAHYEAEGRGAVKLWDLASGQEQRIYQGRSSVAFSPVGQQMATGLPEGKVEVWDTATSQQPRVFKGQTTEVISLAFSVDGRLLAAGSGERGKSGAIVVWDVASGTQVYTLTGHTNRVTSLAFSPNRQRLASASGEVVLDGELKMWNLADGQELRRTASLPQSTAGYLGVSTAGSRVLVVGSGTPAHNAGVNPNDLIIAVDQSKIDDANELPSVLQKYKSGDQVILKIKRADRELELKVTLAPHPNNLFLEGRTAYALSVAISLDGHHLASGDSYGRVNIWDMSNGKKLYDLVGHSNRVTCVAFSPDGQRLASAGVGWGLPGQVKIWDVVSGQELRTLRADKESVFNVTFSPDGQLLITLGSEGIKIWDARPLTEQLRVEHEARTLVDFLIAKPLTKQDAIEHIRTSRIISEPVRQQALVFVERFRAETYPPRYADASRVLVRQPHLNAFQYQYALKQAQAACQSAPRDGAYITTLGMAQYRVGNYEEALATLLRADKANANIPPNLAFLAMTQHQLGQQEPAQQLLTRLREAMKSERWAKDVEAQGFLRETERLIEAKATEPKK